MRSETKHNGHDRAEYVPVTPDDELELLDANDLAELLKVPISWVRSATRSRSKHPIPHIKVGHYTRFQECAVREWLERRKKAYPQRSR